MKTLYRVAALARRLYWFVVRPRTRGVKCVIENDGKWLMIRNTYGRKHWTFPGGRVGLRESPEAAARREALEEVGIRLSDLRFIGSYRSDNQFKHDTVYCFLSRVDDDAHEIDGREVEEARWVRPSAIPHPHGQSVERVNALLSEERHRR